MVGGRLKDVPATFNARAETVNQKPMFRDAFRRKRCLIPASGYYEWLDTPTGKQPYYYSAADGSPLDHRRTMGHVEGHRNPWFAAVLHDGCHPRNVNRSRAPSDDPSLIERVAA